MAEKRTVGTARHAVKKIIASGSSPAKRCLEELELKGKSQATAETSRPTTVGVEPTELKCCSAAVPSSLHRFLPLPPPFLLLQIRFPSRVETAARLARSYFLIPPSLTHLCSPTPPPSSQRGPTPTSFEQKSANFTCHLLTWLRPPLWADEAVRCPLCCFLLFLSLFYCPAPL